MRWPRKEGGFVNEDEKYFAYDEARSILLHALSRISDLTSDSVIESIKDDLEGIVDELEPIYKRQEEIVQTGGKSWKEEWN